MSIQISKVKSEIIDYKNVIAKLAKSYPFVKWTSKDEDNIKNLAPLPFKRFTFEIKNASTELCNAWRRVALDELPFPRITCDLSDIKTDDNYAERLTNYIQNRLWLLSTSYIPPPEDGKKKEIKFTLKYTNSTTENQIIKSSEIKPDNKNAHEDFKFSQNIDIIQILPGRKIEIYPYVEWGINRTHSTFSKINVTYMPTEYENKLNDEDGLPSSLEVLPTNYRLGIECDGYIDPEHYSILVWKNLLDRMKKIQSLLNDFEEAKKVMPYISDKLKITRESGEKTRYEFMGETRTITNILAWYAFETDPGIPLIYACDDHPEDLSSLIRISHKDEVGVLKSSAKLAVRDIENIIKQLSK